MLDQLIRLDLNSFVPVTAQLAEQVRQLIRQGTLEPGWQLPSVRDLAASLGINRNTLAKAIEDLEREGYLRTHRGKGVYVVDQPPLDTHGAGTAQFLDQTLRAAKAKGLGLEGLLISLLARAGGGSLSAEETDLAGGDSAGADAIEAEAELAATGVAAPTERAYPSKTRLRVLLVECNEPQLQQFTQDLCEALPVDVDAILIEDLKRRLLPSSPAALQFGQYRAAVTTYYHYHEVSSLLAGPGLRLTPVLAEVRPATLRHLAGLPQGTVVGVACANWSGASNLRAALENAGLRHLQVIQGCTTVPQSLKTMFDRARVVVCSGIAAADLETYRREHGVGQVPIWLEDRRLDPRGLVELARELGLRLQ
ncbi:MAG: GntR family transcriptional regulator [Symbiobacteriia bacterium]